MDLIKIGENAKLAARKIRCLSAEERNAALLSCAAGLCNNLEYILAENEVDLKNAIDNHVGEALLDRLKLSPERILSMADGLRQIAALPDPLGEVLAMNTMPNGLKIGKQRVAMGVIGIIYEARPNVTSDAFGLCLKAGSSVILRGGKEAIHSNIAIVKVFRENSGLPEDIVTLITDTSRETANRFMKLKEYVDVLIPRGGAGLIQSVIENSTIPVIETGIGNCHIFVDETADADNAIRIIMNAKTQRPAVCNACETVLIHKGIAKRILPELCEQLYSKNVEIRADSNVKAMIPSVIDATDEDYATEFHDYILAMRVVDDIDCALAHIEKYSTGHSEAILTESYKNSQRFLDEVDSACVYVNASTRFTDGEQFGFGAEIGISTQKLHARGPMGLKELTTTKYIIYGNGQIRE